MIYFRATHSSWYQVPVLYGWWDLTAGGAIVRDDRPRRQRPRRGERRAASARRRERLTQPCSSGAIVSPAPLSCSQ